MLNELPLTIFNTREVTWKVFRHLFACVVFKYLLIVSKQWFSSIEEVDCTSNHFLQPKVLKSSWRECISICKQKHCNFFLYHVHHYWKTWAMDFLKLVSSLQKKTKSNLCRYGQEWYLGWWFNFFFICCSFFSFMLIFAYNHY